MPQAFETLKFNTCHFSWRR